MDDDLGDIPDGAMLISGKEIVIVGKTEDVESKLPRGANIETYDLELKSVVVPGLISLHHHFYQLLTRTCATSSGLQLKPWLAQLTPLWKHVDDAGLFWATRACAVEVMEAGYMKLDTQIRAVSPLGLRFHVSRGGIDSATYSDRAMRQTTDEIVKDAERADLFRRFAAIAARNPTVLLHTHLYESPHETSIIQGLHSVRPLEFVMDTCAWGAVAHQVFFAHCVLAQASEMQRMAKLGCGVATCPSSNAIMGTGITDVDGFHRSGVRVGLGLDGPASSSASSILSESRQLVLVQRLRRAMAAGEGQTADVTFSARTALRMATRDAAAVLRRDDELGRLKVGFAADVAVFRVDTLAFAGGVEYDPVASLVVCDPPRKCWMLIVNGHVRIWKGEWMEDRINGFEKPDVDFTVKMVNQKVSEMRIKAENP
ncbi:hypothetical protein HDU93_008074 [Gonapodya sp. JEL0774]|nr:hypothetical protein HDU93_008074 [Gonapodya sp. JEL0774]